MIDHQVYKADIIVIYHLRLNSEQNQLNCIHQKLMIKSTISQYVVQQSLI